LNAIFKELLTIAGLIMH